jgi:hypothetical protein
MVVYSAYVDMPCHVVLMALLWETWKRPGMMILDSMTILEPSMYKKEIESAYGSSILYGCGYRVTRNQYLCIVYLLNAML